MRTGRGFGSDDRRLLSLVFPLTLSLACAPPSADQRRLSETPSAETPSVEMAPSITSVPAVSPREEPKMRDPLSSPPRLGAKERHALPPLSSEERERSRQPAEGEDIRTGTKRERVGFVRPLEPEVSFEGVPADLKPGESRPYAGGILKRSPEGGLTWTAAFSSAGAGALRLLLGPVRLPSGSRVYVSSKTGEVHGPLALERLAQDESWTNTVFAEEIYLEVQFGSEAASELARSRMSVKALGHIEHPSFAPPRKKEEVDP